MNSSYVVWSVVERKFCSDVYGGFCSDILYARAFRSREEAEEKMSSLPGAGAVLKIERLEQ